MLTSSEMLTRNIDVLKSTVNRYGLYGLAISLVTILSATIIVSYQMTGEVTLDSLILAQKSNFALRILDLLPFMFAFWGQYTTSVMAYHASAIIMEETDDLREETTAWKRKSLHHTTHDTLTELPNRSMFYELLREALHVASRDNKKLVIVYINLVGFREINETYGHNSGDLILKELTRRLQNLAHENDIVARLGGDKFILVLKEDFADKLITNEVQHLQKTLEQPYIFDRTSIDVNVNSGISRYPDDGELSDELMQRAELAMISAASTNQAFAIYSPNLNQENPRRVSLIGDLRRAIENDQLELYYQPKIDLLRNEITSVEALVRWNHPEHGRVSPGEFMPLAERGRLIKPLTRWVSATALRESADWHKRGLNIGMSINISARDLGDSELPDVFAALIAKYGVQPDWITLEITESSIMDDPKHALTILNKLGELNFRLSIDDFGTGYSSLAYLSKLPVQEIKIDQSFVLEMNKNKSDELIVKATIDLGHNLGLKVIAEGVENEEVWHRLKQMNCDVLQGYFFSPPLEKNEFFKWLKESRWKPKATDKTQQ
ncbi:MAG: EAL domain-containing protein [Proteobacteria bacterium]|nr:EAL domain-containing protein [Pseudomonadota bacterium]